MRTFRLLTIGGAALVTVSLAAQQTPRPQPAAPAPSTTSVPVNPKLEQYKKDVSLEVDGEREDIQRMNDQVFSFAEPGFQEFETSKYLTGILRKNGFSIQENLAGIPTAWMATWGSGKPVIAIGSDIDGIPQASQEFEPVHPPKHRKLQEGESREAARRERRPQSTAQEGGAPKADERSERAAAYHRNEQ